MKTIEIANAKIMTEEEAIKFRNGRLHLIGTKGRGGFLITDIVVCPDDYLDDFQKEYIQMKTQSFEKSASLFRSSKGFSVYVYYSSIFGWELLK